MPKAPSVEKLHAIKGTVVIFTFGIGTLDWSSEPVQCAFCESKYNYINLHLNDNSPQIHQSIIFKLSDHKANICSYSLIAKNWNYQIFYTFNIFLENQTYPNTNNFDTTCKSMEIEIQRML